VARNIVGADYFGIYEYDQPLQIGRRNVWRRSMRRADKYAFIAAALVVAIVLGLFFIDFGFETGENEPPQELTEESEVDAPNDVMNEPPSATGDIDEP
jgi:hypothetical protein